MAWVKRNLFFVIGASIALIMMVGAGFYTWTGYQHNNEKRTKLDEAYAELKRLTENPLIGGTKGKVNNINVAGEQQTQIHEFLKKAGGRFQRISAIPDGDKVTRDDYASALRLTLDQLQREANQASVVLPPKYNFSFEAQRQRTQPLNLPQLAVQLGEVKAICDILNKARINAIDAIRRERVSTDDEAGPAADYVAGRSQTNDLAVLTPYEVTFRSFSPELAGVLTGFANSPHGIVVRGINVEPAPATAPDPTQQMPNYLPQPTLQPVRLPPEVERYGAKGEFIPGRPAPAQPAYAAPVTAVGSAPRGLPILLNEKQLRVTLMLEVVKLLPKK